MAMIGFICVTVSDINCDSFLDWFSACVCAAFGVRRRPIYAALRATGGDFTYGTNFAVSGSSARNTTYWSRDGGFYTPFSLDVQVQWKKRYQERLWFYENLNPGSKCTDV